MSNFIKYLELSKAVEALPDGAEKEHIKWKCGQLLHLIQGEDVARKAWKKYYSEMRDWKHNIVESIEREIKSAVKEGAEVFGSTSREVNARTYRQLKQGKPRCLE